MHHDRPFPPLLRLQDGEHLHIDGAWLSVVRGRVWVTQAGDPHDRFLDSGQGIWLAPGAQALVGAEGPAQVTVAQAPRPAPAWRRWLEAAGQWRPRALPGRVTT